MATAMVSDSVSTVFGGMGAGAGAGTGIGSTTEVEHMVDEEMLAADFTAVLEKYAETYGTAKVINKKYIKEHIKFLKEMIESTTSFKGFGAILKDPSDSSENLSLCYSSAFEFALHESTNSSFHGVDNRFIEYGLVDWKIDMVISAVFLLLSELDKSADQSKSDQFWHYFLDIMALHHIKHTPECAPCDCDECDGGRRNAALWNTSSEE